MSSWITDPGLGLAASLVLACIFIGTGGSKLLAIDEFVGVVANYRLLPQSLARPFALSLPFIEIAAGVGILLTPIRVIAALIVALLLLAFSTAIAVNLIRGRTFIDCGCFRIRSRRPISWGLVIRNIVMLGFVLLAAAWQPIRPLEWLDFVTAIGAALALAFVYVSTAMLTFPESDAEAQQTTQQTTSAMPEGEVYG